MKQLVFVETTPHVCYLQSQERSFLNSRTLIAMSAEAEEALDRNHIPFVSIHTYADTTVLSELEDSANIQSVALLKDLERFIMKDRPALEGDGFLVGQAYYFQYSLIAVITRFYLMREAVLKSGARNILLFRTPVYSWFAQDACSKNPWITAFEPWARGQGISIELVSCEIAPSKRSWSHQIQHVARQMKSLLKQALMPLGEWKFRRSTRSSQGMRLLVAHSISYDWQPVIKRVMSQGGTCFVWGSKTYRQMGFAVSFTACLRQIGSFFGKKLGTSFDVSDFPDDTKSIDSLHVYSNSPTRFKLEFLEVDFFPSLMEHLMAIIRVSPQLVRYTDEISQKAIHHSRPDAVCFSSIGDLASIRLARIARKEKIPVICFQHGGTYGTHNNAPHEQSDFQYADYFLTYGSGIQKRSNQIVSTRAQFYPVGSARLEGQLLPPQQFTTSKKPLKVLWIGENSQSNTVGGTFLVEDTLRFFIQKQAFQMIATHPTISVTYRPLPHQTSFDGTTLWLKRMRFQNIRTDSATPMERLMKQCDLIIADTESNTTWNETIVYGKPLVLFCNPNQTQLSPEFQSTLEKTCLWTKTSEDLLGALSHMVSDVNGFMKQFEVYRREEYLQKYVLSDQPNITERVVSLIQHLSSHFKQVSRA